MKLAVFDIDGTLIPGASSEVRFARYLRRHGRLRLKQRLHYVGFALCHWPRFGRTTLQKNKAYLADLECTAIEEMADRFVREELLEVLYCPARARLQAHLEQGDAVVLMSGTPEFIARALAGQLGVGHVVATRCSIRYGRFLASPPEFHPFAEEKLASTRRLCRKFGVSLADTIAYADSASDLPLLEAVGVPVAVMPRRALNRTANRRGWEIIEHSEG